MIKASDNIFDDHSISPEIRQTLLYWGYQLKKKSCCNFSH